MQKKTECMSPCRPVTAQRRRRGTEVIEATVRHHISACFGALERRVLDAVAAATQRLRDGGAGSGAQEHSLLQVCVGPCGVAKG